MKTSLLTKDWFISTYLEYTPLFEVIEKLKNRINEITIDIIIDEDCKDVHFLVPRLIKVLDICENKNYSIYHIDLKKLPLELKELNQNIKKVPTIVFKKAETEIFEIQEKLFFTKSIEEELEWGLMKNKIRKNETIKMAI